MRKGYPRARALVWIVQGDDGRGNRWSNVWDSRREAERDARWINDRGGNVRVDAYVPRGAT